MKRKQKEILSEDMSLKGLMVYKNMEGQCSRCGMGSEESDDPMPSPEVECIVESIVVPSGEAGLLDFS